MVLNPRQVRLLRLVASGMTNQEIATEEGIEEQSVKNALTRILDKLAARNRAHAVHRGHQRGIIP